MRNKEVGISTADWAILKLQVPGQGLELRGDGLRFFGDSTPLGENLFRHQIEEALQKQGWRGPSWNAFVQAVSNPETRAFTTIITARMHSPESILNGLSLLEETRDSSGKPLVPALPSKENIYPVLWPNLPPNSGEIGRNTIRRQIENRK